MYAFTESFFQGPQGLPLDIAMTKASLPPRTHSSFCSLAPASPTSSSRICFPEHGCPAHSAPSRLLDLGKAGWRDLVVSPSPGGQTCPMVRMSHRRRLILAGCGEGSCFDPSPSGSPRATPRIPVPVGDRGGVGSGHLPLLLWAPTTSGMRFALCLLPFICCFFPVTMNRHNHQQL